MRLYEVWVHGSRATRESARNFKFGGVKQELGGGEVEFSFRVSLGFNYIYIFLKLGCALENSGVDNALRMWLNL